MHACTDQCTTSQGAKLQYGHVPLYTRGDDANAKQFRSLHAVQRHMVDTNQCRMVYDDDEDEYSQFYDYEGGTGDVAMEGTNRFGQPIQHLGSIQDA